MGCATPPRRRRSPNETAFTPAGAMSGSGTQLSAKGADIEGSGGDGGWTRWGARPLNVPRLKGGGEVKARLPSHLRGHCQDQVQY